MTPALAISLTLNITLDAGMTRVRQTAPQRRARRAALTTAQAGLCKLCNGYMREDVPETHPHRAMLFRVDTRQGWIGDNLAAGCRGCVMGRVK